MPKRILCLCLSLALLFLCGCNTQKYENTVSGEQSGGNTSADVKKEKNKKMSLACSVTDSFCPYTAKTVINRQLAPLMYESLVTLDDSFTPQRLLATDVNISSTTVVVTFNNVLFTNGNTLTAKDVVYCANKAKDGKTRYADALKNVESVSELSQNKVQFNLKKNDPLFENQLDFPIYEAESESKISSDNIAIPPIGSGRYYINEEKTQLIRNENYHGSVSGVKSINLIDTPDNDALVHNLEVENITCYFTDLSDSVISQIRGNYKSVNLNNLVFLGTNMKSDFMKYYEIRRAVSKAIDRTEVCNTAYYQNAQPATGLYNPTWIEKYGVTQNFLESKDDNIYLELLKEIGYNKKNSKGYYVNSYGEELTLNLLNYKENKWRTSAAKLIQTDLKDIGIKVAITSLDWKEYTAALKNKQFDLYIAEVKIGNNMDVSQLITKGGSVAYGVDYKKTSSDTASSDNSSVNSSDTQSVVDTVSAVTDSSKNTVTSSDTTSSSSVVAIADDVTATNSDTALDDSDITVTSGDTANAIKKFYEGSATINDIVTAFSYEMPIIPVCYRKGILSYASVFSGFNPSYSNVYMGIESIN